jgi:hypothetical protein
VKLTRAAEAEIRFPRIAERPGIRHSRDRRAFWVCCVSWTRSNCTRKSSGGAPCARPGGEIDAAVPHFRAAPRLDSKLRQHLPNPRLGLNLSGLPEEALHCFDQAIRMNPARLVGDQHSQLSLSCRILPAAMPRRSNGHSRGCQHRLGFGQNPTVGTWTLSVMRGAELSR